MCRYLSLCNGKKARAGEGGSELEGKGRAWGELPFVLGSQKVDHPGAEVAQKLERRGLNS